MLLRTESVAVSEVGHVREHNEDAHFADDAMGLWLVADGMGGHASGEVASRMAIEGITAALRNANSLESAIQQAHRDIIAAGEANQEQYGMGTTIVALQRRVSGFQIAWVGDSRIYGVEADGELQQLNYDHSFVQDMVFRGVLSEEEAASHEKKNLINQALGMPNLDTLRVGELSLRPEAAGLLLLCSDGVSDMLDKQKLQSILTANSNTLAQLASELREAVLATEASDNFTFLLLKYQPAGLLGWGNRLVKQMTKQ